MEPQDSSEQSATEKLTPKMVTTDSLTTKVIVCQNKTCKQQGSPKILSAFQRCTPTDVSVEASGCLGQCGNGPMVVIIEPNKEESWHTGVKPADVFAIAAQHFNSSTQTQQPPQQSNKTNLLWLWAIGLLIFFSACIALAVLLGGPSHYG